MTTVAHLHSSYAIIDPAYHADKPFPEPTPDHWLYPRGLYEQTLLLRMHAEMIQAGLNVGYDMSRVGNSYGGFTYCKDVQPGTTSFDVSADYLVKLNGKTLAEGAMNEDGSPIHLDIAVTEPGRLTVKVTSLSHKNLLPALGSDDEGWELLAANGQTRPLEKGGAPQWDTKLPMIDMTPTEFKPGQYDLGREAFIYLTVHCPVKPVFGCGESLFELENRNQVISEQCLNLIGTQPGVWQTQLPIACRYFRLEAAAPYTFHVQAMFTPEQYRGAFASQDDLTRIWMNSAYTLRLCAYHFFVDGIKRDRLPWMGDHLINMMSDAYVFGDATLCKRTLTVLGQPGIARGHINGLMDYTLWLPIASNHFQLYWGDKTFLQRQYPEVKNTMLQLLEHSHGTWLDPNYGHMFIDWTPEDKSAAGQILYHYALTSAASLADRMQDGAFTLTLRTHSDKLKELLLNKTFDQQTGLFREKPDDPTAGFNRYANLIALDSGLVTGDTARRIGMALADEQSSLPEVGTPFMSALEILAIYRAGLPAEALAKLRSIWGTMLKLGATSFWEGFSNAHQGNEHYAFYGRPYGKSLCHAWSSGPAFLLPIILFGCEPTADGWSQYSLNPAPFLQDGDAATIPTPDGLLTLEYANGAVKASRIQE